MGAIPPVAGEHDPEGTLWIVYPPSPHQADCGRPSGHLKVPLDRPPQALLEAHRRVVPEVVARARDVGAGELHVAALNRILGTDLKPAFGPTRAGPSRPR